jgi:hypothetical protein
MLLQKLRVPQIQDVKGEALVFYREPLTTQKMWYPWLSWMVNYMSQMWSGKGKRGVGDRLTEDRHSSDFAEVVFLLGCPVFHGNSLGPFEEC